MGVEMVGDDFAPGQLKDGIDNVKPNQGSNHEEAINFGIVDGSQGIANGNTKGKADPASNADFPKDEVDEWLAPKQVDRATVIAQLKSLIAEDKRYRMVFDEKRKELETIQAALGKLRNSSNTAREKGVGLFLSEEELNELLIGDDLDEVRKEQQSVRTKIKQLEEELKVIDNDIGSLQEELTALTQKKDKAFETLVELRKQSDEGLM